MWATPASGQAWDDGWHRAAIAAATCALAAGGGCKRDAALGAPDSFLVVAPVPPRDGAAVKSKSGFPVVTTVALDDAHAVPLHQQFAVGFAGEVLRTDYLAKQLVREIDVGGRRYSDGQRASAREPTVLDHGRRAPGRAGRRRGESRSRARSAARTSTQTPWPLRSTPIPTTIARCRRRWPGRSVCWPRRASRIRPRPNADASAGGRLRARAGGGRARVAGGGGARGRAASRCRHRRATRAVRRRAREPLRAGADGAPRPARELLADPNVTATVLYRLAQSKTVGRKIAPDAVYAPFVKDRVPEGISPAAVLGPFRNFQAKLLSAWARAVLEGKPPADIADLVDAYGRALPAERGGDRPDLRGHHLRRHRESRRRAATARKPRRGAAAS